MPEDENSANESAGGVKVFCRFRPLNSKEKAIDSQEKMNVEFLDEFTCKVASQLDIGDKSKYRFDRVFTPQASQADIYTGSVKPIVKSVMDGFNGTVFAYG
mmetsp:Transcript_32587/g.23535  ORF Transcript_32587/g.23535 Transcript_32587/m.23535 type:complete len:101 (+) Transcript_32587:143-445(+)